MRSAVADGVDNGFRLDAGDVLLPLAIPFPFRPFVPGGAIFGFLKGLHRDRAQAQVEAFRTRDRGAMLCERVLGVKFGTTSAAAGNSNRGLICNGVS